MISLPSLFRRRGASARISSLVMIFQRTPLLKLLPEARVISSSGFSEALTWTVTAIAGLGAFDSVSGASTIRQVQPFPDSPTVNWVAGEPLNFIWQATGFTHDPAGYTLGGDVPPGMVHTQLLNSAVDSLTGTPTQAGTYVMSVIGWELPNFMGDSFEVTFTFNISNPPFPAITAQPAGGNFQPGAFVSVVAAQTSGQRFTWKLDDSPLPAGETVLFARNAPRKFIMAPATNPGTAWRDGTPFNDTLWSNVSGGIGYDTQTASGENYLPHIATGGNTQAAMFGGSRPVAVHMRLPFTISNPAALSFFKLRVQSDDGFVAWVNGTEIASQNKPATFAWNSAAGGSASDTAAVTFREIDIPQHLGLLRAGNNLLAVQAMNQTNTSTDFLFNCELFAGINATNSPRLVLTSLQTSDTGAYTLTVTNAAGSVTSDPAPVLILPSISSHPAPSTTIDSGSTVELHVTPAGSPPFSYQWYRGLSGDTANPVAGANDESFTTPALTETTSFWVRVTTPAGTADSNTATVTVVNLPPTISAHPGSITIENGATTELTVTATGTAPFTYQWYRGVSGDITNLIDGATGPSFTTPALTVTTSYWVRVTNVASSADSNTAVVTVNAAQPDTYTTWLSAQFSPEDAANPAVSGPAVDPDSDGVSNEQEYIFGTVPLTPEPAPVPLITIMGNLFEIKFTAHRASGAGYEGRTRHYAIETTTNVSAGPWVAVPLVSDVTGNDQTVACIMPLGFDRTFCRLKVWLTP